MRRARIEEDEPGRVHRPTRIEVHLRITALEARVVVDADPGEEGDLLPAKPWNAPLVAVPGQTRLLRCNHGSPGGQELADLIPGVSSARELRPARVWGVLPVPGSTGTVRWLGPVLQ